MSNKSATDGWGNKDKTLFNQMLSMYDDKQFKPALKNCDILLEKRPDHTETNAMRALLLSSVNQKDEARALIKKVLFKNMQNFTCWHVMGLLHRKDKEYDQSRRAYLQALKLNSTNESVLRDLCQLQMHLRDYAGFFETRRQMLIKNSDQMESWTSFATAAFLNKQYDTCLDAIESLLKINDDESNKRPLRPNQKLEVYVLKTRALLEKGDYLNASLFLKNKEKGFVNKLQFLELKAQTLGHQGEIDAAIEEYENLLERNSVNYETYYSILQVKGVKIFNDHGEKQDLDAAQQKVLKETMFRYIEAFPRVNAHQRICLRWLTGKDFEEVLDAYVRPLLIKGAPAVMQDLRELYTDEQKIKQIEKCLMSYLASLEKEMTLSEKDEEEQDPTVLLWLLYFISYHFMWRRDYKKSLEFVNRAIEHTPTLLELYTLKGKIYQKAGDITTAAKMFEEARLLDTADRAINAYSALYQAKAGDTKRGDEIMAIFFADCGYESSVHDNQCLWFETTMGRAFLRQKDYRNALKQYSYLMGHLTAMVDDQYDYYLYSMRKFTLTAFEGLMKFNDAELFQFKPSIKATQDLIKLLSKVEKNKEGELAEFQPKYDEYMKSDEAVKLQKEMADHIENEDDDTQKDGDPEGYKRYMNLLTGKWDPDEFIAKVARINQQSARMQAKAIKHFVMRKKLYLAFESARVLSDQARHESHPERTLALGRFYQAWFMSSDEERLAGCNKKPALVQEISDWLQSSKAPKDEKALTKFAADSSQKGPKDLVKYSALEYCLQSLKCQKNLIGKFDAKSGETEARKALEASSQQTLKFSTVLSMDTFLTQAGSVNQFKADWKKMFPLQTAQQ